MFTQQNTFTTEMHTKLINRGRKYDPGKFSVASWVGRSPQNNGERQ